MKRRDNYMIRHERGFCDINGGVEEMKKDCKLFLYITLAICLITFSRKDVYDLLLLAGIRKMGKYFINWTEKRQKVW